MCCGTFAGHDYSAELLKAGVQSPGTQHRNAKLKCVGESFINGATLERNVLQFLRTTNGQDLSQRSEREEVLISLGKQVACELCFFPKTQSHCRLTKDYKLSALMIHFCIEDIYGSLTSQCILVPLTHTWAVTSWCSFAQETLIHDVCSSLELQS